MSNSKLGAAGPVSAMLFGLAAALPADAAFFEGWDDPAAENNGFYYFDAGQAPDTDVDLIRVDVGGHPGGYVQLDLAHVSQWDQIKSIRNHWVAYTYGAEHTVDLSVDNHLTFSMKAESGFDLGGAVVTFWIGEWNDPDDTGPIDPVLSFFYLDIGGMPGDGAWADIVIEIDATGPWVTLADNQSKTAADLLGNPQQWGLGIFGGTSSPSGTLSFDSLRLEPRAATAPLPLGLLLAGLGGLALTRRHKAACRAQQVVR